MAYTARLTKQQLRQRRDATRDRSRDNTKGTDQYLVTYAYTNNNCLLCASNIIVYVAIPTKDSRRLILSCRFENDYHTQNNLRPFTKRRLKIPIRDDVLVRS